MTYNIFRIRNFIESAVERTELKPQNRVGVVVDVRYMEKDEGWGISVIVHRSHQHREHLVHDIKRINLPIGTDEQYKTSYGLNPGDFVDIFAIGHHGVSMKKLTPQEVDRLGLNKDDLLARYQSWLDSMNFKEERHWIVGIDELLFSQPEDKKLEE